MAETTPTPDSSVATCEPEQVHGDCCGDDAGATGAGPAAGLDCGGARPARRSKKREAILDAARSLFCQEGVTNTSMDAVAARAGVSKATLYAHFPSKVDLFGEVLRQFAAARMPVSEDLVALPVEEALRRLAWRFLDLVLTPEALATYRTLMVQGQHFPELVAAFRAAGPEIVCASVGRFFDTLARRGDLVLENPVLAAEIFLHLVKGDPHAHALIGAPLSREQTACWVEEAITVFLRAYAPKSA